MLVRIGFMALSRAVLWKGTSSASSKLTITALTFAPLGMYFLGYWFPLSCSFTLTASWQTRLRAVTRFWVLISHCFMYNPLMDIYLPGQFLDPACSYVACAPGWLVGPGGRHRVFCRLQISWAERASYRLGANTCKPVWWLIQTTFSATGPVWTTTAFQEVPNL